MVKEGGPDISKTGQNFGGHSLLGPALYITSDRSISESYALAAAKVAQRTSKSPDKLSPAYIKVYVDKDAEPVQLWVFDHGFGDDFRKIRERHPEAHEFMFEDSRKTHQQTALTELSKQDPNIKYYLVPSSGILIEAEIGDKIKRYRYLAA